MSRKRKLPSHLNDYITNKRQKVVTVTTANSKPVADTKANSRKKPKLHKQSVDASEQTTSLPKKKKKKELTAEEKLALKLEDAAKLRTLNKWTQAGAAFHPPQIETVLNSGPRNINTPKEEFKEIDAFMLIGNDLINNLVAMMNANRTPNGIIEYGATDHNEVLRFWTALIALAFVKFQSLDDAWAVRNSLFGSTTVQNLITKNRFHEMLTMLQIDVMEWSQTINVNSAKYWKEFQTQAIDDAHPCWSGRSYLVTHKPRKKKPDGIDLYLRCDEKKYCCRCVPRYGELAPRTNEYSEYCQAWEKYNAHCQLNAVHKLVSEFPNEYDIKKIRHKIHYTWVKAKYKKLLAPLYYCERQHWAARVEEVKTNVASKCKELSGVDLSQRMDKPANFTGKSRSKSFVPQIVQQLTSNLEYKSGLYHFYMDREFSSAEIQKYLFSKDFGLTLSAGSDRPSYIFQHYLLRDLSEGTWKSISNGNYLALAYNDYDKVCFITNRHASKNTSIDNPKPAVIPDWNKHCHYVDTFDQFVEEFDYPYKILTVKQRFFHFLRRIVEINSSILFKHYSPKKSAQKDFLISLVSCVAIEHNQRYLNKDGKISATRHYPNHSISMKTTYHSCVLCGHKTKFLCIQCDKFIHYYSKTKAKSCWKQCYQMKLQ